MGACPNGETANWVSATKSVALSAAIPFDANIVVNGSYTISLKSAITLDVKWAFGIPMIVIEYADSGNGKEVHVLELDNG